MAFVSMFLALIFVFALILGAVFLLGVVITIISLIRRRKAVRKGETPKRAGLITGVIIMLVPVVTVLGMVLHIVFSKGSESYKMAKEYRDTLVAGIESDDADKIYSSFSPQAMAYDEALNAEIENMLEFIDGDAEVTKAVLPSENVKYDKNNEYDMVTFSGEINVTSKESGKEYRVCYNGFSKNDDHPEKMGIGYIKVISDSKTLEIGMKNEDK